jgi:hypothetical protein
MSIIKRKAGSEDIVKSILEFDAVPTEGSHNLVESGAVALAIGNLGKPLQWKGPATVSELNAGITGIQPGWTYTLTDAGTLTDGSIAVEPGDEVAWTEDGEWFKVGHDSTTEDIQKMIDDAVYASEIAILSNITPAANTLRFSFSKKDYDPTVAGVGSGGTWTKLATTQANVWDWTKAGNNWSANFRDAFKDSENIVKLISAGNTSVIVYLSSIFHGCTSLESVCIFNTSSVTGFAFAFFGCSGLKGVPLFNTAAATNVQSMFNGCTAVESGALVLYTQMSTQATPPATITDCFKDCGKNTTTGAAELAQIPQSWGGTMPNP